MEILDFEHMIMRCLIFRVYRFGSVQWINFEAQGEGAESVAMPKVQDY
jgi:hypothetical protein